MDRAFDVDQWLDRAHLTGEARTQARAGVNAGWQWASNSDAGIQVESEETAHSAGEGHFTNGFDVGKEAFESGDYDGGLSGY